MNDSLYSYLLKSFNDNEIEDYNAVSKIIPKRDYKKFAVISEDPYLLVLIFTSLMRYPDSEIHILNAQEGSSELQRLLYYIDPDIVIHTNSHLNEELHWKRMLLVDMEKVGEENNTVVPLTPEDVNFKVIAYSPAPTKVYTISSDAFKTMINSLIEDLEKFNLIDNKGIIPFVSNNSDYLLYLVALKIASSWKNIYTNSSLPTENEFDWPIKNNKSFFKTNRASTLFIPKGEFMTLWEKEISTIFENKFMFKSYLKRKWLINIFVKLKLKKLFKGFKNVLIIGTLNNSYIIDVLNNLSFVKVYSVFTLRNVMYFGPISKSLDSIIITPNNYRQDIFIKYVKRAVLTNSNLYTLSYRLFDQSNTIYNIVNAEDRFIEGQSIEEQGTIKKQYFPLGNNNNSFFKGNSYIFPETLEKVINSYPFIRNCVLLTFNKRMILVIHPNSNILDSNRINLRMFRSIVEKQIQLLNKELPEEYQIQGVVITTTLIELDRDGEIVRYPFNHCNLIESGR